MASSNRKRLCTCRFSPPCDREIHKLERTSHTTTITEYDLHGIRQTKTTETTETIEYDLHGIRQTKTTEFLVTAVTSLIEAIEFLVTAAPSLIDIFQTLPSFLGF